MKRTVWIVLSVSVLAGLVLYLNRSKGLPPVSTEPATEPASAPVAEAVPAPVPVESPRVLSPAPAAAPAPAPPAKETSVVSIQANLESALVRRTVDLLVAPQGSHEEKQAAWAQLRDAGKLDQAIRDLEQRMVADPRPAEYPATLGQAYLKKCATLQDVREQGILGMQADKAFDTALALDPSNWEARFTKAVALAHWPASMNKGDEVVQHLQVLIQQQEAQTAQPHFAGSYVWLGEQYQRSGRSDYAHAVWERGAGFFPNDDPLRNKLAAFYAAQNATAASAQTPGGAGQ